ncbi:MAG: Cna B-type domain-containing protein [Ruminococcus sp.]|nr:Cna B-type domain-containing protein [Ruminococcus sp.]
MKKTTRKRILSGISALCMIFVGFILPLVQLRGVTADAADMITIEYRIVFGDYDDKDHVDANNNPIDTRYKNHAPRLWIKGSNFSEGFFMTSDDLSATSPKKEFGGNGKNWTATYERIIDNTDARKDWCYQYKLTLTVPKADKGYYIQAVQDRQNKDNPEYTCHNAFRIANFTPYILDYGHFKHPGTPGNGGAPSNAYNSNISSVKVNDNNKIVYLFLDPKIDWQNKDKNGNHKENPPIDLSMKKRWDGHNAGDQNQHEKEKIEVELQVFKNGTWQKFVDDTYYNNSYYNKENGSLVDKTGIILKSGNDVRSEYRLKIFVNGEYKDYYEWVNGEQKYYDKRDIDAARSGTSEEIDSGDRLTLHIPCNWCNSLVLSYDGCQHMRNAYYYNWKQLPYGNYRVVETRSFYDVNNNNIYESTIDYDTSSEYNYMLYPPQRDSTGVCHIQNYTATMNLTVQKEWWFTEKGQDYQIGEDIIKDSAVKFEVYRSTIAGTPYENESKDGFVARDNNGNVGEMIKITAENDDTGVFTTPPDMTKTIKLSGDSSDTSATYCPKMVGEVPEGKCYYYVREISSGAYTQLNCDDNGFVRMPDNTYCTSYDDGDKRVVHIKNEPEIQIKVNKTWTNPADADKEMNFVLLRAAEDYEKLFGNIGNEDIILVGNQYKLKNYQNKTFKTIGTYTTNGQTITLTSTSRNGNYIVPFKWDNNKAQPLYFYVYELDGDGNSYKVSDYDVSISGQAATWNKNEKTHTITVTNSPKSDRLTQVKIEKKWLDRNGTEIENTSSFQDIHFTLYQSTTEINDISSLSSLTPYTTGTISYSDGWTKTIDNLLKKDGNGKEYYYYVVENAIQDYDTSYAGNGTNSITICNTDNTINLTVQKEWETLEGIELTDDHKISVNLVQYNLNNKEVTKSDYPSQTIIKNGSCTFENLPTKSADGSVEYGYNITENMSTTMAMQYKPFPTKDKEEHTIHLKNELKKGNLKVKKEWEGIDEIPDNIKVSIAVYRNGNANPIETFVFDNTTGWGERTIENIPAYMGDAAATPCHYTIQETVIDTTTGLKVEDYERKGYYYEFSDPNSGKTKWEPLPNNGCTVSEGSTLSLKAVNRKKGFSLPSTGGTGTTVYTVFGAALIFSAVGAYAFISFKKRRFGCK